MAFKHEHKIKLAWREMKRKMDKKHTQRTAMKK